MWDIVPRMDLLKTDADNGAYLSAREGEFYVIYFTNDGKAAIDLGATNVQFTLNWISLDDAQWRKSSIIKGGSQIEIESEISGGCFAVLTRK